MSKFRVNGDHGFVGMDGVPVRLSEHDEYDGEHALVLSHPHLFDEVVEAPKRPTFTSKHKGSSKDD